MTEELKPCPFCGSASVDPEGVMTRAGHRAPACNNCGAAISVIGNREEDIKRWNTRPADADQIRREALEAAKAVADEYARKWSGMLEGAAKTISASIEDLIFTPAPTSDQRQKALEWSEHRPPNEECSYDHVKAETPLGPLFIEWKGWKDHDDATCDLPWPDGFVVADTVEEAKSEVERQWRDMALAMLGATPAPAGDRVTEAARVLLDASNSGKCADTLQEAVRAEKKDGWELRDLVFAGNVFGDTLRALARAPGNGGNGDG